MAATAVISVDDVHKTFKRRVHALRGVTMRVHEGEVFGLLGPNGAGKSTLVKILMTVIRPTRLKGSILGKPVGHKPTLRKSAICGASSGPEASQGWRGPRLLRGSLRCSKIRASQTNG